MPGMIIAGAAEFVRERLAQLVYVDAFIPDDGQSVLDFMPESNQTALHNLARTEGDGWRLPASEARLDRWGLKESRRGTSSARSSAISP